MTYTPHGKHLIAGQRVFGNETFKSEPVAGDAYDIFVGTPDDVEAACAAAAEAFKSYRTLAKADCAVFLNAIADEIDARGEAITHHGSAETGLPEVRLQGERRRTVMQLRLFADHILKGDYLDRRHDEALPDRKPSPRPDLKIMQRPIGPVGVFGASNFPLAFSTAGGDTAAALAAGCPVVVKGHSAHPVTGEIVAEAVLAAVNKCHLHPGVFSLVQGGNRDVGQALVLDHRIQAVGFTGSLNGGRALYNLAASRPKPIPFFGELGSVNPMFMLPEAMASRGDKLGSGWAGSLLMGAGQFCTNPGIAVVVKGDGVKTFVDATMTALKRANRQTMLTDGIAEAYAKGIADVRSAVGVEELIADTFARRTATAALYKVSGQDWLKNEALSREVFGPMGLIIEAENQAEMLALAEAFEGQITCTLHMDEGDMKLAKDLMPVLEQTAGRVLANGFPTGVEVSDAMVHGGPYPASTNFGATSVGTLSIRRFLRPVCYQNIPDELLPGGWS
jgi:NADP-dependent aldehyde dehydrogenase